MADHIDKYNLSTKTQIISFMSWPWTKIIRYYLYGRPRIPIVKDGNWYSDTELLREWKRKWLTGEVKLINQMPKVIVKNHVKKNLRDYS